MQVQRRQGEDHERQSRRLRCMAAYCDEEHLAWHVYWTMTFLRTAEFGGLLRALIEKRIRNAQNFIWHHGRPGYISQFGRNTFRSISRYLGLFVREMFGCLSKGWREKLQRLLRQGTQGQEGIEGLQIANQGAFQQSTGRLRSRPINRHDQGLSACLKRAGKRTLHRIWRFHLAKLHVCCLRSNEL